MKLKNFDTTPNLVKFYPDIHLTGLIFFHQLRIFLRVQILLISSLTVSAILFLAYKNS